MLPDVSQTKEPPAPDERAERERLAYALVVALARETLPPHALRARARAWVQRFGVKEAEG